MFYCPEFPWKLYLGRELATVADLQVELLESNKQQFDFISTPLVHPRFTSRLGVQRNLPLTRSDYCLPSDKWNRLVYGRIAEVSSDSENLEVRQQAEKVLVEQLQWGIHLGVNTLVLPQPQVRCANYARIINQFLANGLYYQSAQVRIDSDKWEVWNAFRLFCGPALSLGVQLVIGKDVPDKESRTRWLGEPVKSIVLPPSTFIQNKSGYPVLSKCPVDRKLQAFVKSLLRLKVSVIIGTTRNPEQLRAYVCYLFRNQKPVLDTQLSRMESYEQSFWDVMQAPLQPLMDNLESQTYETFERDAAKYIEYERAITNALHDNPRATVLMVVGAGRGPLVRASLNASKATNRTLKIYAIEKNPMAIVTLKNLCRKIYTGTEWKDIGVEVIEHDMRTWVPEQLADILVSELLGSFGDNELSPECLDCASRLLKPTGISIPCRSTSYLAPVSSQKNWAQVVTAERKPECPYVVKMHNAAVLRDPLPCFVFDHPSTATCHDRFCRLSFPIEHEATMHGFIGYFDAILYGEYHTSTLPSTHTPDMSSWFPIFFPIKTPQLLEPGDCVEVCVWRCSSSAKVWYEWLLSTTRQGKLKATSGIHNPSGKHYWIGK